MARKHKATSLHNESSGDQHSAGRPRKVTRVIEASSSDGQHFAGGFSLMLVDENNFDQNSLPSRLLAYKKRPPISPNELEHIVEGMNPDVVVKAASISLTRTTWKFTCANSWATSASSNCILTGRHSATMTTKPFQLKP